MGCLKCGAATEEHQVFCANCQDTMQAYPVKPGTVVTIPARPSAEKKSPSPKAFTAKEQIARLRSMIRWLVVIIAVLSVLLCLTAVLLIRTLEKEADASAIGRNYTSDIRQQP